MHLTRPRGITLACALAAGSLGCQSITGLSDLEVVDDPLGADSQTDGGTGGTGGTAGDGGDASPDTSSDACTSGPIATLGDSCCTSAELACAGHAQKVVLVCDGSSGEWSSLQACSGQQLCDTKPGVTQGSCQDPVALCIGKQPGETLCDGNTAVECGPDLLTSTETSCTYACDAGECTGECASGTKKCNDTTPQTCNASGQWQSEAPCAYVCSGQGECMGVCTPASKQCNGNIPQTCDASGAWVDGAPCANVCSAGQCVAACTNGDKQCSGAIPQTCVGGTWQDATACSYVCSAGNCTGVCAPGAKQCNGLVPQTCDANGQWQSGSACSYVCSAGSCTGVCAPNTKQCSGLTPQTCNASGQWQSAGTCPYVCSSGDCTGVCAPGSKQCNGLTPQTCNASGQWDSGSACPYQCSAGQCVAACTDGTKQCSGVVPQTCVNGNWQSGASCSYVCSNGDCTGVCTPGSKQCSGNTLQTCQSTGQWDSGIACSGSTPVCSGSQCVTGTGEPPSCAGGLTCGTVSCCSSILVPGGTFPMGRSVSGTDACPSGMTCYANEQPEHNATVADFKLDQFEVTVGRFRKFVQQYNGTPPAEGAAAHPLIAGSGWQSAWNSSLPSSQVALISNLKCAPGYETWTEAAGAREKFPINCVDWYAGFAFCAWDGARLPTEAEWEYASAGGDENRLYPWGSAAPDKTLAAYECLYSGTSSCTFEDTAAVGALPSGAGRWGHKDLAGNMWEWALDWYSSSWYSGAGNICNNCANLTNASSRVRRGGDWNGIATSLRAAFRTFSAPTNRYYDLGFRCARKP